MKKYFLSLAVATLSLGFTACEDVPAPYEVNGDGSNTGSSVILDEKFSTSLGDFSAINTRRQLFMELQLQLRPSNLVC